MKSRLLVGTGLVVVIAIASLVGFNIGNQSPAESSLAASEFAVAATDASASELPVSQEISEPDIAPVESVQTDITRDSETNVVSSSSERSDSASEGIKVHGRWTLEVTEPDGKLVSHTEFDNALVTTGAEALANVLAHDETIGIWQVKLSGSPNPCDGTFGSTYCGIIELPSSNILISSAANNFGELSVTAPSSPPNDGSLVLAGSATIANDTSISTVSTEIMRCGSSVAPDDISLSCGGHEQFTLAFITPVQVLTGQIVNVTVVISFS